MEILRIAPGLIAVHASRLVTVCVVKQAGRVTVRDLASGETYDVPVGELSARTTPAQQADAARGHAGVVRAGPKLYRAAQDREKLVVAALVRDEALRLAVEQTSAVSGVSARTLWRWIALYRARPSTAGLLLEKGGVASKARRLSAEAEREINSSIDAIFLTQPRGTYQAVCDETWRRCDAARLRRPSRNAIVRRLKALDPWIVAKHQLGRDEAQKRSGFKPGSLRETTPLAIVQIDHTLVDIHVVDDDRRQSIGRPWITLAIDVATRCILGFHLTLEAPGTASVAACIAHACLPKEDWLRALGVNTEWPVWGLPQRIQADNAREFRTDALSRGCDEWGIKMSWRPIGRPHYGGHIERLIGTLMGRIHLLPGTTQSNPQARGAYKSEKAAQMTLAELERWIALEICGRYHLGVHRSLRRAPLHAWQDWFAGRGEHPAIPGNADLLRLSFMPIIHRKLTRQGISFNRIQYWDNVLPNLANLHERVLLRYDPRDVSRLFAMDEGGRYWPIPYADLTLPAITLAEAKAAMAGLHKREGIRDRGREIVQRALEQREIVKQSKTATKRARRDQQRTVEATRNLATERRNGALPSETDFNRLPPDYGVEIWEPYE